MEGNGLHNVWLVAVIVYVAMFAITDKCTAFGRVIKLSQNGEETGITNTEKFQERSKTALMQTLNGRSNNETFSQEKLSTTPIVSSELPTIVESDIEIAVPELQTELAESGNIGAVEPQMYSFQQFQDAETVVNNLQRPEYLRKDDKLFSLAFFDSQGISEELDERRSRAQKSALESFPLKRLISYAFGMNDRLRRNVFGKDTRVYIDPSLSEAFPFSSVVRLGISADSRGCTGTLIWHSHVLTAAHCVHDGIKYRPPLWKLKVGLLRRSGTFKWMNVKRAFVPNAWIKKESLGKIANDYAVLELDQRHGRPYMSFGWHDTPKGRIIQFSGFPADKPINEMWFSHCTVQRPSKKILYNYCDAFPGMSGSGVYVYDKVLPAKSRSMRKGNRKVIAIFSTFVEWRRRDGKIRRASNTATRLTSKKVERICNWMKAGRGCKLLRR